MNLFDVYPLSGVIPVSAKDCYITAKDGRQYLDLYGGHAVISVGHSHPHYVKKISGQLEQIGFYSNSVINPLQEELAEKLGEISGYADYSLFLCNSGAEANENAFKLASFHTGRKKIIAFHKSFHGRTSAAVAATDDPSILSPLNESGNFIFCPLGNTEELEKIFRTEEIAAIIIEGIQGVGGINIPSPEFLQKIKSLCEIHGALMICDEVQSGYGRTGKFFAHQHAGVLPDLITIAKGMGNGFPVAGVLIHPAIKAKHGMLGTTFGGNYLACAASIAVLDILKNESLMENAKATGNYLLENLCGMEGIREARGCGLMIGIEMDFPVSALRQELLSGHKIFTGTASDKKVLRLLPPLTLKRKEADIFLHAFKKVIQHHLAIS